VAYFSNSTEGEVLDAQCADCPLGHGWRNNTRPLFEVEDGTETGRGCPVQLVQSLFNYDQMAAGAEKLRSAMRMLIDDSGTCHTRAILVRDRDERREAEELRRGLDGPG